MQANEGFRGESQEKDAAITKLNGSNGVCDKEDVSDGGDETTHAAPHFKEIDLNDEQSQPPDGRHVEPQVNAGKSKQTR